MTAGRMTGLILMAQGNDAKRTAGVPANREDPHSRIPSAAGTEHCRNAGSRIDLQWRGTFFVGGSNQRLELALCSHGLGASRGNPVKKRQIKIVIAQPRGFCAGVVRAIDIVERALHIYGAPVYVRHEIVHNKHVVESLRKKGARFVEQVDDIPVGAVAVFSAHGVSRRVEEDAGLRSLHVIDATCPLVSKVHNEAKRYARQGYEIVLIGHSGHPEIEGTMGQVDGTVMLIATVEDVGRLEPSDPNKLAYVTQTTLSVDDTKEVVAALKARFPKIVGPNVKDICYATQNRQTAVRQMVDDCDLILVIGADYSSNSNRLREISEAAGTRSYLIPDADSIRQEWFEGATTVGITAGASAPEELVQGLVHRLCDMFDVAVEEFDGIRENVTFRLPRELKQADAVSA